MFSPDHIISTLVSIDSLDPLILNTVVELNETFDASGTSNLNPNLQPVLFITRRRLPAVRRVPLRICSILKSRVAVSLTSDKD